MAALLPARHQKSDCCAGDFRRRIRGAAWDDRVGKDLEIPPFFAPGVIDWEDISTSTIKSWLFSLRGGRLPWTASTRS